jgi:hypothetical protein
VEIRQLELDLWQSLEAATRYPETANLQRLCDALEGATLAVSAKQRAHHPLQEQLQVAGEMLRQITEVYAARAEWMMSGWELHHNPQEPVVNLEGYAELFAQSLSLDLGELFEEPDEVMYPSDRQGRSGAGGTVVGLLDKEALLAELDQRLEEHPEMTEADAFEAAISAAHGEDVSAWVGDAVGDDVARGVVGRVWAGATGGVLSAGDDLGGGVGGMSRENMFYSTKCSIIVHFNVTFSCNILNRT